MAQVYKPKILNVQPSTLIGYPDKIEILVCVSCGGVIFDPHQHDEWHQKLLDALPTSL